MEATLKKEWKNMYLPVKCEYLPNTLLQSSDAISVID